MFYTRLIRSFSVYSLILATYLVLTYYLEFRHEAGR